MAIYRRNAHSVFLCDYHLVWPTKYRREALNEGVLAYLKETIKALVEYHPDLVIKEINGESDHIHLLISIPPQRSVGENQITINKSRPVVYDFLADGLNNPKWREAVIEISLKSGKTGAAGAEYKQLLKGPGGRQIDGDYKIVEAQPSSKLIFEVTAGPARPRGQFELESVNGGTILKFTLES